VACNFNYLFENEGILKVTASHVCRKCGIILCTMSCISDSLAAAMVLYSKENVECRCMIKCE